MPLTSIAAHAADYELLLPALVALTAEVEEKRSHGCKLLDIIAAHANCGIPLVQTCMQRILSCANQVLFAQISAWVVHGMLTDPYREFFVFPALHVAHADAAAHAPQSEAARAPVSEEGASLAAAAAAAGYADVHQFDADHSQRPATVSPPPPPLY